MEALEGTEIAHIGLGDALRARSGNPYAVIHRGELHGVLLRACINQPAIVLRTQSEIVEYRQDGSGV